MNRNTAPWLIALAATWTACVAATTAPDRPAWVDPHIRNIAYDPDHLVTLHNQGLLTANAAAPVASRLVVPCERKRVIDFAIAIKKKADPADSRRCRAKDSRHSTHS